HRGHRHFLGLTAEIEQLPAGGRVALARDPRRGAGDAEVVTRPRNEALSARVRLEAPSLAARALPPVRRHDDVTEVAGGAAGALVELAAQDESRPDGCTDQDDDQVVDAAARAGRALAPGSHGELA